ncbi:2-succinyl-6-hydroxy- -cyclohexadiene-1-carboxylate synthase [Leptolyngbya sp. Heron Island J]|uniref:alpha/beta fold hydrolase n=1 Tax=Leptolyngbya sp. Heron Island J TaxID=1385935 RepID=UPI0003B93E9B|nr:alpha/beta fold hydrolase [Leptolyngbya sp. Heron Island J]ESA35797.1 2-succinyl-6-hydroxy- -cyclohexadiene-1-carboxylate synthase [Leptolyngbya sp. Heron Island J]
MKTLWCLHGNLQQPGVWGALTQKLQLKEPDLHIQLVNLWNTLAVDCWTWTESFCQMVQAMTTQHNQPYLLGYSLGGRLAWHALVARPELWAGAVIVSADTGLAHPLQKEQCLSRDRAWAYRFLSEPWDDLLAEWDALPVFCGRPCLTPRLEAEFDRQKIARAFEVYSKGHMDDLTNAIQGLSMPIAYITGRDDQRYCQLGQMLEQQCPTLTHSQIAQAGHRVPWEQPDAFLSTLMRSISQ